MRGTLQFATMSVEDVDVGTMRLCLCPFKMRFAALDTAMICTTYIYMYSRPTIYIYTYISNTLPGATGWWRA